MQHFAQNFRFIEVKHSANSNEVGQLLCGNSTINEFAGSYKGNFKRAFIFDCQHLPEARKRPWRTVPRETTEAKERLTGIVTYMKPGDFILFFDAGSKDNLFMCHEVIFNAVRSGKTVFHQFHSGVQS